MSQNEAKRAQILEHMTAGKISQTEAAKRIGVTVRQVHRLDKRCRAFGLVGLISKKRGRVPNNRIEPAVLAQAMALIGANYADFGPTLPTEKPSPQHAITLSVETVRQQMIVAGLWQPKKGSKISIHPMRCRRACFGELIQIDGSPHDWVKQLAI